MVGGTERARQSQVTDTVTVNRPASAPFSLLAALVVAQFGLYLALLTPSVITVALRVAQIVPPEEKAAGLGVVFSVGAVVALIANPLSGALSDRTRSRFGRRRPWMVGGMAVGAIGLLTIAAGNSIAVLLVGWSITQLGCNAVLSAITACIPDLIPDHQRGRVSGLVGVMGSVAIVAGTNLTNLIEDNVFLALVLPAAIGLVSVLILTTLMRGLDKPAVNGTFARYSVREFLQSFWVNPVQNKDYALNFAGRFLCYIAIASVTSYQVYFLMDQLHYSAPDATEIMSYSTLIILITSLSASVLCGFVTDRIGRRKPFVIGASAMLGTALTAMAFTHSLTVFMVAIGVYGVGYGVYLSVDLALAAALITNPASSAKEMGVLNIANTLPQTLVSILAPVLLSIGGGNYNYTAFFLFSACSALLAAVLIQFIRSVR